MEYSGGAVGKCCNQTFTSLVITSFSMLNSFLFVLLSLERQLT